MPGRDEIRQAIEAAAGGPRAAGIQMSAFGPRGLVAWIESEDDIASLFIARQSRILSGRSLARGDTLDYGYEGCSAQHLAWYGDRVVVVSSERYTYLRSVDPESGKEEGISLSHAWHIDRDLLICVDDDPGLLRSAVLPSLDPGPPLSFRGCPRSCDILLESRGEGRVEVRLSRHAGNRTIDTLVLPTGRQRADYAPVAGLLDVVVERLLPGGGVRMGARLAIEAVGYPFVRSAPWRKRWQPVPVWIPVYWHRHLVSTGRAGEARELVDVLDAIAAPLPEKAPEGGWNPEWSPSQGQVELAVRHVRRQARVLSPACRSGALPPGWWCLLFDPAPGSSVAGSRIDLSDFPPTLRRAFEELARTAPEELPKTW